ncbi:aromatic amino acid transport family protein [Shewanella sp. NIFS-20-20]|uniref:aromatic amino acid transport family protein n=1 Tax=Shewanella sp. NIFS-20-20 TaxID=2853806 RepID=UPI001C468B2A|nr:aromatic amino acid transport family protein [Shewanella sp. NIFS-20-20]MBV7314389.1 tyrosine transporter TyrP [Shewanella sp. NIFS-20-20]
MKPTSQFGSILIIAGTTIGAGMLALPLAAAGLGFGLAIGLMLLMWALMAYTALLMVELHHAAPRHASLHSLAHHFLGQSGQWLATFAMLFLFYALCSAYIAGGAEQLTGRLSSLLEKSTSSTPIAVLFTLLIASLVALGTRSVDLVNRSLFALKIIALVLIFYLLLPEVKLTNLTTTPLTQGLVISALPIIFTSFGFHGSIPSVVRYLGKDIAALKRVILAGSAIPLLIYCLWLMASQGTLAQSSLMAHPGLSAMLSQLAAEASQPIIGQSINVFAELALATSFLGVSLGLFDFIQDMLKSNRLIASLATFAPPLAFALFFPQGFILALGYAAIALVILAVYLPVAMVNAKRRQSHSNSQYQVAGGKLGLVVAFIAGTVIIAAQLVSSV